MKNKLYFCDRLSWRQILKLMFFTLMFFSVTATWAASTNMVYPVSTKAGGGSYPKKTGVEEAQSQSSSGIVG